MPNEIPVIQFAPNSFFERLICQYRENKEEPCNIYAAYDDDTDGIIYVNTRFYTGLNDRLKGTLVHEMVHYLQDLSGKWEDACQARKFREQEAYIVQGKYMKDVHDSNQLLERVNKQSWSNPLENIRCR